MKLVEFTECSLGTGETFEPRRVFVNPEDVSTVRSLSTKPEAPLTAIRLRTGTRVLVFGEVQDVVGWLVLGRRSEASETKPLEELLNLAWGLIANAYGGDWDLASESSGWKAAAERWRDAYHQTLPSSSSEPEEPTEPPASTPS